MSKNILQICNSIQNNDNFVINPSKMGERYIQDETIRCIFYAQFFGMSYKKISEFVGKAKGQVKMVQNRDWWPRNRIDQMFWYNKTHELIEKIKKEGVNIDVRKRK